MKQQELKWRFNSSPLVERDIAWPQSTACQCGHGPQMHSFDGDNDFPCDWCGCEDYRTRRQEKQAAAVWGVYIVAVVALLVWWFT